jgi:hypothetical protein
MPATLTSEQVWREIEKRMFAVLGFVTARGEARTTGIVYLARDRHIYIATWKDAWKAKHIAANPRVSLTVTIPKRVPFMPWIRIPDATITLQGEATLHAHSDVPAGVPQALIHGLKLGPGDPMPNLVIIRIRPAGHFLTYGIGVPLGTMRDPEAASARVPV